MTSKNVWLPHGYMMHVSNLVVTTSDAVFLQNTSLHIYIGQKGKKEKKKHGMVCGIVRQGSRGQAKNI